MEGFQHRSYRTILRRGLPFWFEFVMMAILSVIAVYIYTRFLHNASMVYFSQLMESAGLSAKLTELDIFHQSLLIPSVSFAYNTQMTLLITLAVLIITAFILVKQNKISLNIVFWIVFLLLLGMIFVVYFLINGSHYPYDALSYFELYLHAYIGFMLMCFIVMSVILALTPETLSKKLFVLAGVLIYYMFYGVVRLSMTILLVSEFSVVFSGFLYLTIFYDFILIIYIYSIMLYKDAQRLNAGRV